jgi:YHS domain-containing protein
MEAHVMSTNITSGKVLVDGKPAPGIALHGYDPVAYFTVGAPAMGDAETAVVHGDATYRFASPANRDAFKANPARYLAQYGGFCAFGVSVGAKFDGDPTVWRIVDDKLYLNLSKGIQQEWFKNIPANIEKAQTNWRTLSEQPA